MSKMTPSLQKLRGAYYTPIEIVDFLTKWAIQTKKDKILEPSFGAGIFLDSACRRFKELGSNNHNALKNITAVELDSSECNIVRERLRTKNNQENIQILNDDFFSSYKNTLQKQKFDSVIGNPPFIRYQNFDDKIRERALGLLKNLGFKASKLTNIWMPFLVMSSMLLNDHGRIAMIIPAEILQVTYAAELREFLSKFFSAITIVTFKKLIFPNIQQEVVLFLAEKNHKNLGINIIELENTSELNQNCFAKINDRVSLKPIDHGRDKWVQYFLTKKEILFLRKLKQHKSLKKFVELAEVDVGVVTGRNEFFVINQETVEKNSLSKYILPIVSRSFQLKGASFTKKDFQKVNDAGNNCNLFFTNDKELDTYSKHYIKDGENKEFHTGYKCRIRKPWHNLPSIWTPDAFLFRQINHGPRLVLNKTEATATDTIHRVRLQPKTNGKSMIFCFHNSLTFAFSEIMGRSYGGGVLELEPNEAEELPVPYVKISSKNFELINKSFKEKKPLDEILDFVDNVVLKDSLQLSQSEINSLRKIWKKLSSRRTNRRFVKP
mgnify:CR=1 FL=1